MDIQSIKDEANDLTSKEDRQFEPLKRIETALKKKLVSN